MILSPAFLITSSIVYLHHFFNFDAVSIDNEYKGKQSLFIEAKADTLTQLVGIAKIQSTETSNKIEGICISDARLKALVKDKTTPIVQYMLGVIVAAYRDFSAWRVIISNLRSRIKEV